jgi:hypothetical protein
MTDGSSDPAQVPRPLTPREAEILQFMLSPDGPRLAPLRDQAEVATVVRTCGCGCATIDLAVDRIKTKPAIGLSRVPIETVSLEQADARATFFLDLFLENGWLSSLEISYLDTIPSEFPPASAFRPPTVRE